MAVYLADTSFWMALSRKRGNGLSDSTTRGVAAEGYRRVHADARIEVVPFQPELINSAVQLYRARLDKDWSITDCLSIAIMERRRLMEALTTDGHFEQAGLKAMLLLRPPLGADHEPRNELVSEYEPEVMAERAGGELCAYREWGEYDLLRSGE